MQCLREETPIWYSSTPISCVRYATIRYVTLGHLRYRYVITLSIPATTEGQQEGPCGELRHQPQVLSAGRAVWGVRPQHLRVERRTHRFHRAPLRQGTQPRWEI